MSFYDALDIRNAIEPICVAGLKGRDFALVVVGLVAKLVRVCLELFCIVAKSFEPCQYMSGVVSRGQICIWLGECVVKGGMSPSYLPENARTLPHPRIPYEEAAFLKLVEKYRSSGIGTLGAFFGSDVGWGVS